MPSQEIIPYPPVSQVAHLGCRRIRESDVEFHSHMSGFVYKVNVGGEILIKKEIPSPETIEEFLYEINALNSLGYSENVINFHGVVVDEYDEYVKGLLISYADGGALIDVIYDNCKDPNGHGLAWAVRERWARQIVSGLGDIHESGFVQGDFTLSNIVIDHKDDAKIIDINRRGCPVGWEPPEATPLLDSNHRISMYIGIKSDLYQLGMVLWALAMEDDEPDLESRPLLLGPEAKVPDWYRVLTETCLNPDPRRRLQASQLAQLFPPEEGSAEHISVDDGLSLKSYYMDECGTVRPPGDWSHYDPRFLPSGPPVYESWNYAPRGRSPPSPLPSNPDMSESHRGVHSPTAWAARRFIRPSYSDAGVEDIRPDDIAHSFTPTPTADRIEFPQGDLHVDEDEIDTDDEHHSVDNTMTESKNNALMDEQVLSESSDVYQASDREDSDAGGEIANIGDKEEASYDVEKPTDFSDTEDALAPDETKVAEVEVLQAKETNPSAIVDDESVENATADMDTPETANLGENEVDDLVVSKDHAAEHDEVEKTSPDTKEEDSVLSNGHISEAENGDAVTAAPAVVLLEPKAENNIDLAPKDGIDRHTSEENPDGGTIAPPPTHDAEEDPSGVKGNEDAMKVTDTSTPIQLPEQPAEQPGAQPELTVNKEDDIRTENGPLANPEGPELQPDGPAEQAPGQQEMPASESCPPGKLDVSELVSGEDVQGPQSSDPPDDSNPPDQQSGIQAEQTIPEMPTVAETDDQVIEKPTPEVASNGATTTDNNAADSQALVDTKSELGHEVTEPGVTDTETSPTDLPDSLAGVGSGLPTVETDMLSEQNYIYDDDFHATKQPEPLTT